MMFEKTDLNRVKRAPQRGHYDQETVYAILDAGYLCHVGFMVEEQPFVIPTLYARDGDSIYLHGSAASRMLNRLAAGIPVCLTVTQAFGTAQPDPQLNTDIEKSPSVMRLPEV